MRRISDHLQGPPKVAYFTYSAFGATPKVVQKTSQMVPQIFSESLTWTSHSQIGKRMKVEGLKGGAWRRRQFDDAFCIMSLMSIVAPQTSCIGSIKMIRGLSKRSVDPVAGAAVHTSLQPSACYLNPLPQLRDQRGLKDKRMRKASQDVRERRRFHF